MNLHMPQDDMSEMELRELAAIPHNIISPGMSKPIIGIFQDSLVGCTSFTRQNVRFDLKRAMNLLAKQPYVDLDIFKSKASGSAAASGDGTLSNFDVLTQIMPPITLKYKSDAYKAYESEPERAEANGWLEIVNGHYKRGQLVKGTLAAASKGLLHRIYQNCGKNTCVQFIDDLQYVINEYMKISGYSVGISDLIWNAATQKQVENVIAENKKRVTAIIGETHLGIFKNETSKTNYDRLEEQILNVLNEITHSTGKIAQKTLGTENRFVFMSDHLADSKGKSTNLAQMVACLGQQAIYSARVPYGYDNRSLPHFKKYDDSAEARGFIEHSFIHGLNPSELFFHAISGRIGLIDTAVKSVTWETPVVLLENGRAVYTEIGRWVDGKLDHKDNAPDAVERHKERNLELLRIPDGVYIPTTDHHGAVTWGACTAVTRHDPGEKLYAIRTLGGREVTVTESKSLLVWDENARELREVEPTNIKIGDKLPVTETLGEPPVVQTHIERNGTHLDTTRDNGVLLGIILGGKNTSRRAKQECIEGEWLPHITNERTLTLIETIRREGNIPTEAFASSKDFVVGLLSGIVSNGGYIDPKGLIRIDSPSKRFLEGVAMLCSRIGVFASISQMTMSKSKARAETSHRLSIRAQWARRFADNVDLVHEEKAARLRAAALNAPATHRNFDTLGDVVLDAVTSIEAHGVEAHPKMYDLTIPSTLNFGLANGLQVRDTSETGYIQRRLIKAMEDIKIEYDMTVRNHKKKIVQFAYGGDSIDTMALETQSIEFMKMSIEQIYGHFYFADTKDDKQLLREAFTPEAYARMRKQATSYKAEVSQIVESILEQRKHIAKNIMQDLFNDEQLNTKSPVHFKHSIGFVINQAGVNANTIVDVTPLEVLQKLRACYGKIDRGAQYSYLPSNELFRLLFFHYLSPKQLVLNYHMNEITLDILLDYILLTYKKAVIPPGEMVGIISAQSVGEPTTQETLNTFHNAGVASKTTVTTGLPRIQEILKITDSPARPSMTIYMRKVDESETTAATQMIRELEHVVLKDVVDNVSIYYDPNPQSTVVAEDQLLVRQFNEFASMVASCANASTSGEDAEQSNRWVFRIRMNVNKMLEKNITMDDVYFVIKNGYSEYVSCVYSDYNASNLVFRLRINIVALRGKKKTKNLPLNVSDEINLLRVFEDTLMSNTVLKGINKISSVHVRRIPDSLEYADGKYTQKEIWVLDTIGTNLQAILALDTIDNTRTMTNDINEIRRVLGIEAARQVIMNELHFAFTKPPEHHHMSLLVDRMTYNTGFVQIYRHGINNDDIGPIAKASFEETPQNFIDAAVYGMLDEMRGISSNVMCGQEGICGTNMPEIILNMQMLDGFDSEEVAERRDVGKDILAEFEHLAVENAQEGACSKQALAIDVNFDQFVKRDIVEDDDYEIEL